MSQIIPTYPIFEGSQVLTSDQLNQLSAYLDQQNRLTRSKLIGIGIVCGLQVQPLPGEVKISKGLGITSEGFLIQIGTDFLGTHYRPYTLPETVTYKPFGHPTQNVKLWEMLSEKPDDETEVKKLNSPANFLNDKYVLLFLEIFDRDLKSCLGNSCDDKGKDRIFSLRRLLITKADLDMILPSKTLNVSGAFSGESGLKAFRLKKPIFDPSKAESNQINLFVRHYQDTILETVNPGFWDQLKKGYTVFEPILGKSFSYANPFDNAAISSKISLLQTSLTTAPANIKGIQYLWDFFKELALAWEEFLDAGHSLWYSCPTDPSLFPLHLMLGKAKTATAEEFYTYRHGFVQPPIFNEQKLLKETVAQRYSRLVLMIETLELDLIRNPKPAQFPVKITPSKEKMGPLGHRSLPYYYNLKSKGTLGSWFSLEKTWKDPGSKNLWSADRDEVLSYDNQPDTPKPKGTFLESPLHYDLEDYPFLRIEGHLDQELEKAKTAIEKLIKDFNLPIHLETLHMDAGGTLEDKNCGWHDLQEEYAQHRFQLVGMMRDLKEILSFLRDMNKKYGEKEELFDKKVEEQVMKYFELFESWAGALEECLENMDWQKFQDAYKKILQTLLDVLLIQFKFLDNIDIPEKESEKNLELYNGLLARVSPILYRILDLFYFTKIQRLYLSYVNRVAQLQNSRKFSEYLKKNPGLVHEAGVYRDGTFFLLYLQSTGRVIGDFSMTGTPACCECIDACGDDKWNLLPPFARPDYAITNINTPIRIEVMVNDRQAIERIYVIKQNTDKSEKGGEVKQDGDKPAFFYTPPKDFSGDDAFSYILLDEKSGLQDEGRVTIWVKAPRANSCYTYGILECFGNVRELLATRGIDDSAMPEAVAINTLLASLTESKGFTEKEIFSGYLESDERKIALLKCMGIDVSNEGNQELASLILEYQKNNCGTQEPPTNECRSTSIRGQVVDPDGRPISGAFVLEEGTINGISTNDKGEFALSFSRPGVTLIIQAERYQQTTRFICSERIIVIPLSLIRIGGFIGVRPSGLNEAVLEEIISVRGLTVPTSGNPTREELIRVATEEKDEITLGLEDLSSLRNDTLRILAAENNIEIRSTDTKAIMVNKLLGKR